MTKSSKKHFYSIFQVLSVSLEREGALPFDAHLQYTRRALRARAKATTTWWTLGPRTGRSKLLAWEMVVRNAVRFATQSHPAIEPCARLAGRKGLPIAGMRIVNLNWASVFLKISINVNITANAPSQYHYVQLVCRQCLQCLLSRHTLQYIRLTHKTVEYYL